MHVQVLTCYVQNSNILHSSEQPEKLYFQITVSHFFGIIFYHVANFCDNFIDLLFVCLVVFTFQSSWCFMFANIYLQFFWLFDAWCLFDLAACYYKTETFHENIWDNEYKLILVFQKNLLHLYFISTVIHWQMWTLNLFLKGQLHISYMKCITSA